MSMLATAHRRVVRAAAPRSALFSTAAAATAAVDASAEVLQLQLRPAEGSRAARRLRKQGLLPGIVYGEDAQGNAEKVLVALNTRTFEKVHRKLWTSIENHVFDVQIGESGEKIKAIMRDVQFDVVTDAPLAVNFLRYRPGHKVRIPITYLNEEGSPGLKRGGYINHIHHELECMVYTDKIPETLQVDVNGLHVGDRISLDAIEIPEGIVPVIPAGSLVAKVAGRRGLIPRAEPVVEVVEEVVEEEVVEEEFDEWNDIF